MFHPLFYFYKALNAEQFPECELAISKLLEGQYRAVDLEKLHGHSVYSIRTDSQGRLLFTTVDLLIDGVMRQVIVFLEFLPTHQYDRSKFLKPNVLKKYREATLTQLTRNVDDDNDELSFEKCNSFSMQDESPSVLTPKPMTYFKNHIVIDESQSDAIKCKTPLIFNGAAGTGKTCLSLMMLAQHVRDYHQSEPITFYYVAELELLINQVAAIWDQYPEAHFNPLITVVFTTFEKLALLHNPKLAKRNKISKEEFNDWCQNKNKKLKQLKNAFRITDPDKIYQEFRKISALTLEEYTQLGVMQSLYPASQRRTIYDLCNDYRRFLGDKFYDPAFLSILPNTGEFMIFDEALDLSWCNLKSAMHAAINFNVVFLIDPQQSLQDAISAGPYLQSLETQDKRRPQCVSLYKAYRSPLKAVTLANLVFAMRNVVNGGASSKGEIQQITCANQTDENSLLWFESFDESAFNTFKSYAESIDFAVITLPEFVDDAVNLYGTELVYTIHNLKGCQYPLIVLHRIFEDKRLNPTSASLKSKSELIINPNLPKEHEHAFEYITAFNQLSCAILRVQQTLIIYQPQSQHNRHIIQLLKPVQTIEPKLDPAAVAPASEQQWEAKTQQLEAENPQVAERIRSHRKRSQQKKTAEPSQKSTTSTTTPSQDLVTETRRSLVLLLELNDIEPLKQFLKGWYTSAIQFQQDNKLQQGQFICRILLEPYQNGNKKVYLLPRICRVEIGIFLMLWVLKNAELPLLKKQLIHHINFAGDQQSPSLIEAVCCKTVFIEQFAKILLQYKALLFPTLNPKLFHITASNHKNLSVFIITPGTNAFLTTLLVERPDLAISSELHNGVFLQPNKEIAPIFYQLLLRTPENFLVNSRISILYLLHKINPLYALKIEFEKLLNLKVAFNNHHYNALELLIRSQQGMTLFAEYYQVNTEFQRQMTGELLLRNFGLNQSVPHQILLVEFLTDDSRLNFLLEKCQHYPQILSGMNADMILKRQHTHSESLMNHYSLWLLMSVNTMKLKLLNEILRLNPEIVMQLTRDLLCRPFEQFYQFHSVTKLFFLFNYVEGIAVLKTLLNQRPEIANFFTFEDFARTVVIDDETKTKISVCSTRFFRQGVTALKEHSKELASFSVNEIHTLSRTRAIVQRDPSQGKGISEPESPFPSPDPFF